MQLNRARRVASQATPNPAAARAAMAWLEYYAWRPARARVARHKPFRRHFLRNGVSFHVTKGKVSAL